MFGVGQAYLILEHLEIDALLKRCIPLVGDSFSLGSALGVQMWHLETVCVSDGVSFSIKMETEHLRQRNVLCKSNK